MNRILIILLLMSMMIPAPTWAEKAEDDQSVHFTLIPEEYVVNYALALVNHFGEEDEYLLVPIYDFEDEITAYFVIFPMQDYEVKDLNELFLKQKECNAAFFTAVKDYLAGLIDNKISYAITSKNRESLSIKEYYQTALVYPFWEVGPFGEHINGIPAKDYWLALEYLRKQYDAEPVFRCFRFTEEMHVAPEFEVDGETVLIRMDLDMSGIKLLPREECSDNKGFAINYKAGKFNVEDNKKDWERYSTSNAGR